MMVLFGDVRGVGPNRIHDEGRCSEIGGGDGVSLTRQHSIGQCGHTDDGYRVGLQTGHQSIRQCGQTGDGYRVGLCAHCRGLQ